MRDLVLATRGSALAMVQAHQIQSMLGELGVKADILKVSTKGDRDRVSALKEIGGNGLFMREVEKELLDGHADIAVHCGKDLPYEIAEGLEIGGVPAAADGRDCLVVCKGTKVGAGSRIGTGSARRIRQLEEMYPGVEFLPIRGNINTRLDKLAAGEYDGIVLARAGMDRLQPDLSAFEVRTFSEEEMIPACTQGILALECRSDDQEVRELLAKISDETSRRRFEAERYLFTAMKADCTMAVAIHAELAGEELTMSAMFEDKKASAKGEWSSYRELCDKICAQIYRK